MHTHAPRRLPASPSGPQLRGHRGQHDHRLKASQPRKALAHFPVARHRDVLTRSGDQAMYQIQESTTSEGAVLRSRRMLLSSFGSPRLSELAALTRPVSARCQVASCWPKTLEGVPESLACIHLIRHHDRLFVKAKVT